MFSGKGEGSARYKEIKVNLYKVDYAQAIFFAE